MWCPVYKEIQTKTALNKLKRKIPYGWDLNLYRGCAHGCRYCYALYSHQYVSEKGPSAFYTDIYAKTNIVDILERELKAPGWQRDVINIGGVTDSYQPLEKELKLMPAVLKLLIKYKTPAIISTKSDLVLRDFDLIEELSRLTYVNVAATITTVNEDLRKVLEPCSAPSSARLAMLKEFDKTNASTGLHLMPIIPLLTDSEDNLDLLMSAAADSNVDYLLPGVLYLRGLTRKVFMQFIADHFPELSEPYQQLYVKGGANREYKEQLYQMVNRLRDDHGLEKSYMKPMREKMHQAEMKQLNLEEVLNHE